MPNSDDAVTLKAGFTEDGKVEVLKVKCNNGELHRLQIKDGRVLLLDHPQDEIEAEQVMTKLGGRPCECVRFLMWERQNMKRNR